MSLILVVEPDSRHAAQLASIARNHLHAELVMADSGDRAVAALDHRVPDIVLTAPLLPHHDEAVLSDYLRALGEAGAHVQTLTIPILSTPGAAKGGVRARFRKERATPVMPDGCDPALFAEQVGQYLHRARQRRVTTAAPPAPVIAFRDTPTEELLAGEIVSEEQAEDVDLTPFLQDLSEPADHYELQAERSDRFDASGRFDQGEPIPTYVPAEPPIPTYVPVEPPIPTYVPVEPIQRLEPVERAEAFEAAEPSEPSEPTEPTEPFEPYNPSEPIQSPDLFVEPVQTAAPVARVAPIAPVEQVERFATPASVEPAARVEAVQPFQPAQPVQPIEPVAPVRRVAPVVTPRAVASTPVMPVAPVVPAVPVAPVAPVARSTPAVREPLTPSYAEAPSRAELLPALAAPLSRRGERRRQEPQELVPAPVPPVHVPQVITVPANTGDGSQTTASVNVAVAVSVQVAAQTTVSSGPSKPKRGSKDQAKPVQDEWGFFDPDQCGFRALLARLDAIAAKENEE